MLRIETLNKKLESLKTYLLDMNCAEPDELNGLTVKNCYNSDYNTFEVIGNEYKVLTDAEANRDAKIEIVNNLWAFNADFILRHTEFYNNSTDREDAEFCDSLKQLQESICESANSIVKALITDIDTFVDDAIDADGRGRFLSFYDGREDEQDEFFIYLTN